MCKYIFWNIEILITFLFRKNILKTEKINLRIIIQMSGDIEQYYFANSRITKRKKPQFYISTELCTSLIII